MGKHENKFTDLILARDTKSIDRLIKAGKLNVNAYVVNHQSALAVSAAYGYIDVMKCLIENGADVNLQNEGDLGYTPIEEAARAGQVEAIKLLLENNAQIDKGNTIDTNALIGACISAEKEALELLLAHKADINHVDNSGQTALHYLCRFATQWGSWTLTETIDGVTKELENPRFKQHTAIFNILLNNGADVNKFTNYGLTPLHWAADSDTHSFIAPLIRKGAKVNVQNSRGYSPLHAAAEKGNLLSCKELIENGADIDIVDNDGFTPILGATCSQNIELVKFLLERGANKKIKAKVNYDSVQIGDDALNVAKRIKNRKLIELLK